MLDIYFIESRAKLLDIASFLDRIDRYKESEAAKGDFRYRSLKKALKIISEAGAERTKAIQLIFSDTSKAPIESAVGLAAFGAWEGVADEGN